MVFCILLDSDRPVAWTDDETLQETASMREKRSALKIWYKLLLKLQVPSLQPVTCSHTACWSLVVLSISALSVLGTVQKICAKVT